MRKYIPIVVLVAVTYCLHPVQAADQAADSGNAVVTGKVISADIRYNDFGGTLGGNYNGKAQLDILKGSVVRGKQITIQFNGAKTIPTWIGNEIHRTHKFTLYPLEHTTEYGVEQAELVSTTE